MFGLGGTEAQMSLSFEAGTQCGLLLFGNFSFPRGRGWTIRPYLAIHYWLH